MDENNGNGKTEFQFESEEHCFNTCNITQPEWCRNIEVGLSPLIKSGVPCLKTTDQCFTQICQWAQNCEQKLLQEPSYFDTHNGSETDFCPTVFDGWTCIEATPAGQVAKVSCPAFYNFNFHEENKAFRHCAQNGTWWDENLQKPFTDYSQCPDTDKFQCNDWVIKIYISGYTTSIIFLLLATTIFFYFRRALKCIRNEIHTHLFLASILHNMCWLIWYGAVIYRMDTYNFTWTDDEKVGCIVLHVLKNYFMVAAYMWMLCEGLYLFIVLVVTFISEKKIKFLLYSLGWGLPVIVINAYFAIRYEFSTVEEMKIPCWNVDISYNWIYKGPCITSVFVNLFFLGWIVYVLVSKFHTDISDHAAMKKTAKAIALLVPLFGLHHFIAAFKPDNDDHPSISCGIEIISAIFISFQGVVVAILFCLVNNEVINEVKKFFGQQTGSGLNGPQSMAMTQYTVVPRANGQSSPIDSLSTVAKTPATGDPSTTAMEMVN